LTRYFAVPLNRKPAPKRLLFLSWRRVLWQLRARFDKVRSEQELEEEVKILFLLGAPERGCEGCLDFDGVRNMIHCLDPYVVIVTFSDPVSAYVPAILLLVGVIPREDQAKHPSSTTHFCPVMKIYHVFFD
jgi:hypothetical protein